MHTATQFSVDAFALEVDGRPAELLEHLQWGPRDRLGIVVDCPLGAVGASLMIQAATAAFMALSHRSRHTVPVYADHYLFHVGRRWGDFSAFDFWPERREVDVARDPGRLLEAINSHGITHLLVPDQPLPAIPCTWRFGEDRSLLDRLCTAWAYGAGHGQADSADVFLQSSDPRVLENPRSTAWPPLSLPDRPPAELAALPGYDGEYRRWCAAVMARREEVSNAERLQAQIHVGSALAARLLREGYRRLSPTAALALLGAVATPG